MTHTYNLVQVGLFVNVKLKKKIVLFLSGWLKIVEQNTKANEQNN